MVHRRKKQVWLTLLAAALLVGLIAVMILSRPKPIVPKVVQTQMLTVSLVPLNNPQAIIDSKSFKYDSQLKVMSYNVSIEGVHTVISEQPTPETFIDVPQYYSKFIDRFNEYGKFDTEVGVVHLTMPPQLHGDQAAVLNTKGVLLFGKPAKKLNDDQWRRFFNSLTVNK